MANKTIEDLLAVEGITGDELLHLVQNGNSRKVTLDAIAAALSGVTSARTWAAPFRGALAYRATELTDGFTANSPFLVPWNAVEYDTDGFWNIAQPTRITIPEGVNKVRLRGQINLTSVNTAHSVYTHFYKNGTSEFAGSGVQNIKHSSTGYQNNFYGCETAIIPVAEGDYFELRINGSGTTAAMNDILPTLSWLCVEVVEGPAVEV